MRVSGFRGTTFIRPFLTETGLSEYGRAKARRYSDAVTGAPGAAWAEKPPSVRGSETMFRTAFRTPSQHTGLSATSCRTYSSLHSLWLIRFVLLYHPAAVLSIGSFPPQRLYGAQAGGFDRRVYPEQHAEYNRKGGQPRQHSH